MLFNQRNAFENVCEMAAILSRGKWVSDDPVHRCIYVSPGLNVLTSHENLSVILMLTHWPLGDAAEILSLYFPQYSHTVLSNGECEVCSIFCECRVLSVSCTWRISYNFYSGCENNGIYNIFPPNSTFPLELYYYHCVINRIWWQIYSSGMA